MDDEAYNIKVELAKSLADKNLKKKRTESRHAKNKNEGDYSKALVGRKLFHDDPSSDDSDYHTTLPRKKKESAEVEILGERKFTDTCNIMSNKLDDLYNAKLSLGSGCSSMSKENFVPKRMMNASKHITSPYDMNPRSIKPLQMKYYEAITTLCDIEESMIKWVINIDNVRVTTEQLGKSMKLNGIISLRNGQMMPQD